MRDGSWRARTHTQRERERNGPNLIEGDNEGDADGEALHDGRRHEQDVALPFEQEHDQADDASEDGQVGQRVDAVHRHIPRQDTGKSACTHRN